jgi:peptidoglycan/xylan/chitin deacetylase (PgdA/CDA1 family)
LPGSGDIVEYGNGKMYRIRSLASSGERILSFSGRTVVAEEYARLPKNLSVERFAPGKPKTVVLTFHGGPDAVVGDRILEFLRNRGIRSTFFPAADAVASYSGTLHRILADGHLVGNHASWT